MASGSSISMAVSGRALIGLVKSIRGASVEIFPGVLAEVGVPENPATTKSRAAVAKTLGVAGLLFINYLLLVLKTLIAFITANIVTAAGLTWKNILRIVPQNSATAYNKL